MDGMIEIGPLSKGGAVEVTAAVTVSGDEMNTNKLGRFRADREKENTITHLGFKHEILNFQGRACMRMRIDVDDGITKGELMRKFLSWN